MHAFRLPLVVLAATLVAGCDDAPVAPESVSATPAASPAGGSPTFSSSSASPLQLGSTLINPAQGEINASGTATLRCVEQGTLIVAHVSGLAPKAVYTLWLITTGAKGAAGAAEGSQNIVQASASGDGQFSIFVRPSDTGSFTPGVHWPDCVDGSNLIRLVVDGHTDGLSHGGVPGPDNYDLMRLP